MSCSHFKFRELAKLFPAKSVFEISESSHFEVNRRSPSTAPRGMTMGYRAENMNRQIRVTMIFFYISVSMKTLK